MKELYVDSVPTMSRHGCYKSHKPTKISDPMSIGYITMV